MSHAPLPPEVERIAKIIVECCFRVHSLLGPGLLESVYERCLCYELRKAGLRCERQVSLPIWYDGHELDDGLTLDLLVEGCVIVELKAVEAVLSVHTAQLMTYLKLSKNRLGFLVNFNVPRLKGHVKRYVI